MFIIPHGAPEGYEWFVALVVLVGLYFAVRSFMRARKRRRRLTPARFNGSSSAHIRAFRALAGAATASLLKRTAPASTVAVPGQGGAKVEP
jgi:hypothetical protein